MSKKAKKEMDALKIITLGESGVGKTSIIRRYIHNIFDENNLSTIGLNFSFKEMKVKNGDTINLKVIDTAGQEKYKSLAKSYFKNVDAVLFVFALNKKETFDDIKNWIKLFDENRIKSEIPRYLVGNKSDQNRDINDDLIEQFKNEYQDFKYYETSAKSNDGIDKLFQQLAEDLYSIVSKNRGRNNSQKNQMISNYKKKKDKNNDCICAV